MTKKNTPEYNREYYQKTREIRLKKRLDVCSCHLCNYSYPADYYNKHLITKKHLSNLLTEGTKESNEDLPETA